MSQSIACSVVYAAKKQAEKQKFPNILRLVYKKEQIFKVANQKKPQQTKILLKKIVTIASLVFTDDAKEKALKLQYNRLLN